MKKILLIFILFLFPLLLNAEGVSKDSAIDIAYKKWVEIYGKDNIESQKPFQVKLIEHDFEDKSGSSISFKKVKAWKIEGTFHGEGLGGVAMALVEESSGKILRVSHSR